MKLRIHDQKKMISLEKNRRKKRQKNEEKTIKNDGFILKKIRKKLRKNDKETIISYN